MTICHKVDEMNKLLTIAVPTYNRNVKLCENLKLLLPQMTDRCKLLILDNNSDRPVCNDVDVIRKAYSNLEIEVIRNKVNIGANANILRCFELCETQWVWVLGDDDKPKPDAIMTILSNVESYEDFAFINFSSEIFKRDTTFTTEGLSEFIEGFDSFSNTLFISTCVFNAHLVNRNIRIGYFYCYSMAPHFAALLKALELDGKCCFSSTQIVSWEVADVSQRWSFLNLGLGIMKLLELVSDEKLQKILATKILRCVPEIRYFIYQLLGIAVNQNKPTYALFLYDQIFDSLYCYSFFSKFKCFALRFILIFPKTAYCCLYRYKKFRGINLEDRIYDSMYKRL